MNLIIALPPGFSLLTYQDCLIFSIDLLDSEHHFNSGVFRKGTIFIVSGPLIL